MSRQVQDTCPWHSAQIQWHSAQIQMYPMGLLLWLLLLLMGIQQHFAVSHTSYPSACFPETHSMIFSIFWFCLCSLSWWTSSSHHWQNHKTAATPLLLCSFHKSPQEKNTPKERPSYGWKLIPPEARSCNCNGSFMARRNKSSWLLKPNLVSQPERFSLLCFN